MTRAVAGVCENLMEMRMNRYWLSFPGAKCAIVEAHNERDAVNRAIEKGINPNEDKVSVGVENMEPYGFIPADWMNRILSRDEVDIIFRGRRPQ